MAQNAPKLVIFGDARKGRVAETVKDFISFVETKARIIGNYCLEDCSPQILADADYAVVFGGDGSIIGAARSLSETNVPVIGVNLGKLGFLAEFNAEELKEYFDEIIAGKAQIEKRMQLCCSVSTDGSEKLASSATNDIFITAGPPYRVIELQISVDGQRLAGCVSDGIIIATATGSTAYNLSAGGPILSREMDAMVITPICPHSLSFRPIVIQCDCIVEIRGMQLNEGTTLSIDGQHWYNLSSDDTVRVHRHQGHFMVVSNPRITQWDTLATKLNWAEKPRYI